MAIVGIIQFVRPLQNEHVDFHTTNQKSLFGGMPSVFEQPAGLRTIPIRNPSHKESFHAMVSSVSIPVCTITPEFMAAITDSLYKYGGDQHLAEEACAEAVARLYAYGVEKVHNIKSWILHVGRNYIKDHFRRKATRATVSLSHTLECISGIPPRELAPESRLAIRGALTQLSDTDQVILLMRYSLRWTSEKISIVLGIRVTAVDMRLVRARRRLASLLSKHIDCDP